MCHLKPPTREPPGLQHIGARGSGSVIFAFDGADGFQVGQGCPEMGDPLLEASRLPLLKIIHDPRQV
jgi:hypothetical protein